MNVCRQGRATGPFVAHFRSGAWTPGDLMYQREECIAQASICREKAQADPAHYDYWIDEAIVWHQRGHKNAVTHEVHDGRLIPKQVH